MTTHGDMIMEYGGVPVGAGRLAKLFQAKNIFFVDNDLGKAGDTGMRPSRAVDLPSTAVGLASKEGIIYIRPRTTVANADVVIDDNVVIPITKPHIQLIGAGAGTVPGYRGSAQLQPLVDTTHLIEIRSSGVCIENLHLNNTGGGASMSTVYAHRTPTYPGCVATQIRHCRLIHTTGGGAGVAAISMGSNQYSIIEDNLFLDCYVGISHAATYGSPQGSTVRRNIFAGLPTLRDVDIWYLMTDINSRGHTIDSNVFSDGLPEHASGSYLRFIYTNAPTTIVSTGMISNNAFAAPTGSTAGEAGDVVLAGSEWFLVGNQDEDGPLPRS